MGECKSGTYYANNREARLEYDKKYYEENKEAILIKSKVRNKKWYEENKEAKLTKEKERVTCECGCEVRRKEISRHKKSNKHIKLMEGLGVLEKIE